MLKVLVVPVEPLDALYAVSVALSQSTFIKSTGNGRLTKEDIEYPVVFVVSRYGILFTVRFTSS
jgi:hypothetical protein